MERTANFEDRNKIYALIQRALDEDIGSGDVTTSCIVPEDQRLKGRLLVKGKGIIAGVNVMKMVFDTIDAKAVFSFFAKDGDPVEPGQVVMEVEGKARSLLTAERTALNLLQRMSGIATKTRQFVDAVKTSSAVILDTRKTAPGLRVLDKMAVKIGNGKNHRFGLYDMVLIKENHITSAGSITGAVKKVKQKAPGDLKIEVEVKTLEELKEAMALPVDRILLDNMTDQEMARAVETVHQRIPLEASGNMTLERVKDVAAMGIDYISVGSLTHSVQALDVSFLLAPCTGAL